MTISGCDYSDSRPPPADLFRHGIRFAGRYYSTPGNPKNLNLQEALNLLHAGIDIVSVYETTATFMMQGRIGGADAMRSANAQALLCGQPDGSPIFFACDFQPSASELPIVLAFLAGCYSVSTRFRVGVYGSYSVCVAAKEQFPDIYTWQTAAWSGGLLFPKRDIYQPGSILYGYPDVDEDLATTDAYGGWHHWERSNPPSGGDDMSFYVKLDEAGTFGFPLPPGKFSQILFGVDHVGAAVKVAPLRVASWQHGGSTWHVDTLAFTSAGVVAYTLPRPNTEFVSITVPLVDVDQIIGAYFVAP